MIGIGLNFTISTEKIPTKVKKKDDATIQISVHKNVFPTKKDIRNLYIETIAVQKINGTTRYRPNLMNNVVINSNNEEADAVFNGRITAAKMPINIPNKYLIQSFILLLYHTLVWDSRV